MAIYSRSFVQSFDNWRFWIRKTHALLNLISQQDDTDKIFLYAKNLSKTKYDFLIKKCEVDTLFDYENPQQQRIIKYCN